MHRDYQSSLDRRSTYMRLGSVSSLHHTQALAHPDEKSVSWQRLTPSGNNEV